MNIFTVYWHRTGLPIFVFRTVGIDGMEKWAMDGKGATCTSSNLRSRWSVGTTVLSLC